MQPTERIRSIASNGRRLGETRTRLRERLRRLGLSDRLALVLAIAALLSGIATFGVLTGTGPEGPDARTVLVLLNVNLILMLLLGAVVARRLVQLVLARRQGSAGSKLHIQFVALLSAVAVLPAILVAVFSILFLNYGLDSWFSDRVRQALANAQTVAQAYLEEHKEIIRADALAMAADLNREGPALAGDARMFQNLVDTQAAIRSLTEAVVLQSNGRVVARSGLSFLGDFQDLPMSVFDRAATGDVQILTSETDDRVRALVRLDSFVDAYLFVGRFVDPVVLGHMETTQRLVDEYQLMAEERSGIQITFALLFMVVALLLLLAAVWVALSFANRLVTPISWLIAAANRVSQGDLTARVPAVEQNDEVASLSRAFNRMTGQLAGQRQTLIEVNDQLDSRRRFTEAVLSGVSSGVLGVDDHGRITLPNRAAAAFLDRDPGQLVGEPLITVVPEFAGLLTQVAAAPDRTVGHQLDVIRAGQTRTLIVRASAQTGESGIVGFVVSFDDISDLLQAQRKAAWSEIARRIAHEIKNPLTPIRLSAERLRRRYLRQIAEDPDIFTNCTDTIIRQVDNIRRLIDEFSSFARMPAPVFNVELAGDLVRQAVTMQEVAWPAIAFETTLPADEVHLYCDSHQVAQALINLLQNAVDSVRARHGDSTDGRIAVSLSTTGRGAVVEVRDNGSGFPPELRDRLTQPYVTSRAEGTGLGLAIVDKIMEQHGGSLMLVDPAEGGAAVQLFFPAVPQPPAVTAANLEETVDR
ncbi:ATP-binding protein [Marinivivus vitaminiproducens]|uniref:sensor histidine kinase NtrY-like n=1 Tax=Marinivivus vitaminiproducens TaxID=3035935 RepID=UPI00279F09C9|nr:PAS domain-containing sensor histidine kinase [Geminicoccaceae bacterium SCSIO 64248]